MPRVKSPRRKPEYIHTALKPRGGGPVTCNKCGYTGEADLIESTALCTGYLERCPICKSTNITYKEPVMPWKTDEWKGCYPSSWKGMIVPQAMSHPAKFSSKLIRRIYEHLRAEGWVKEGDKVIDPFGGVGLGSLDAMRLGLEWFGVELELKFVDLGQQNISNWDVKFHKMPKWGKAVLCQGDSRKLLQVLRGNGAGASVSSPPYAQTDLHYKKNGLKENGKEKYERPYMSGQGEDNYGATKGNLGEMNGDNFEASISSPPFADSLDRGRVDPDARRRAAREQGISNSEFISPIDMERRGERNQEYGSTPGQLGAMQAGDFDLSVSSPPYKTETQGSGLNVDKPASFRGVLKDGTLSMGESEGNLGNMDDGNFAAAMISSPPYTGNVAVEKNSKSINREKQYAAYKASGGGQSFEAFCATQELHSQGYGDSEGQLSAMPDGNFDAAISSPPFGNNDSAHAQSLEARGDKSASWLKENTGWKTGYGQADGQLAEMNMQDGFSAAISSPPFRHSEGGTPEPKPGGSIDSKLYARHAAGNSAAEGYGASDGQLANMGENDETFEAAISSPPYEGTDLGGGAGILARDEKMRETHGMALDDQNYGVTDGQLGNDSGDDFWMAARQIVEQVYLALAPGGHAVWVTKRFVKNKEIVEFSDQWRQLCEAVGFKTVHWHRALLVHGKSYTLDGGEKIHESKSFFRRLSEKNKSPRIDWEDVLCMVKE